MRSATSCLGRGALCVVAMMSWVYGASAASEDAHALAQKFSAAAEESERAEQAREAEARAKVQAEAKRKADAEKRRAADAQRAADEAEMLRNAKDEAEARRAADRARTQAAIQRETEQVRLEAERQAARAQAERLAEEARQQKLAQDRQAEEQRRAEAERLAREADEKRKVEAARIAEEQRKAEDARVTELKRKAEEAEAKRRAEEARVAELKRQAEEAEAKRAAEEQRLAEQRRMAEARAAEQRAALEAQREAEAQRIAEKFRLAREARERNREIRNSLGAPLPADQLSPSPFIDDTRSARSTYPQRVTVLVVMQPRRHGFAGAKMTANPVLCVGNDCYVSNGAASPARMMRRAQTLGPGNTIGRNAGVCRNDTTCVFRGVTLPAPLSTIQPVDMGFLRHDRKEIRTIEPDVTCALSGGQLACSGPIETEGYRAWIVPETVAEQAGARALQLAVDHGLPSARSAAYGSWSPSVQALPTR